MMFTLSTKKYWIAPLVVVLVFLAGCKAEKTPEQALLENAFNQEEQYRKAVRAELLLLKKKIPSNNPVNLKERIQKRISHDLKGIEQLNEALKAYPAKDYPNFEEGEITWSLKRNRMQDVLSGAEKIIDEQFDALVSGALIDEIVSQLESTTVLGSFERTGKIVGSPQASYIYAALYLVLAEIGFGAVNLDVDGSAIFHVTPLPIKDFSLKDVPAFTKSSWFYTDDKSPATGELLTVHGGYIFGGMRGETRYGEELKPNGPQDCSSWVRWLLNAEDFSTEHQLYHWRANFGGFVPDGWLGSKEQVTLEKLLSPVKVSSITDIKPGYIYTDRTFDPSADMNQSRGSEGHVGIVTRVNQETGMVTILSYRRCLTGGFRDGLGLMDLPYAETNGQHHKRVFYFKPKK